jgi:hypothetical protein
MAHSTYYIFTEWYFKEIFGITNTIMINAVPIIFDIEKTFKTNYRIDAAITSIVDGMETLRYYKELSALIISNNCSN